MFGVLGFMVWHLPTTLNQKQVYVSYPPSPSKAERPEILSRQSIQRPHSWRVIGFLKGFLKGILKGILKGRSIRVLEGGVWALATIVIL